ncbi:MAG: hypothetical protein GF308_08645 [Candidatus Heimdallarchaeota archaeon]|nr:hypothetical protein [Candidatus Heimdallarchaeota archaeon]
MNLMNNFLWVINLRPPCEIITQLLLPLVRGMVAKELTSQMTQQQAAKKMGVSQPAVSGYLKSLKKAEENEAYFNNETIQDLAHTITQMVIADKSPEQIIKTFCSTCVSLRIGGLTCRQHIANYPALKPGCQGCLPISEKTHIASRKSVLNELEKAISIIEEEPAFTKIMPEVRINLCQCIENPKSIDDVAAIPGRVIKIRERARAILPPEFGVSEHTAKILITINNTLPRIRSAICITYNEELTTIFSDLGIKKILLSHEDFHSKFTQNALQKDSAFSSFIKSISKELDDHSVFAIINKGGMGIEPITYLFGHSAIHIAKASSLIAKRLNY